VLRPSPRPLHIRSRSERRVDEERPMTPQVDDSFAFLICILQSLMPPRTSASAQSQRQVPAIHERNGSFFYVLPSGLLADLVLDPLASIDGVDVYKSGDDLFQREESGDWIFFRPR